MTHSSAEAEWKRVVNFIETFCTLGGSFLGQRFVLEPFQKAVIRAIYAPDGAGNRLIRSFLLGLPRKNGKSTLAAALALYHLFADPFDASPVVISAAGDRQQAKIVFNEAKRMVLAHPALRKRARVYRDHITTDTGGTYRAVSADAGLQQGLNPSFVVVDELHVFQNEDLISALTLGSAMRNSPLFLFISTAGFNLDSPLGRLYQYGRKVESGELDDPSFGFTWYGPRDGEEYDPTDPKVWAKYNPAFHLMNRSEFAKAQRSTPPNDFARFRLNAWTATESAWLPLGVWEGLEDEANPLLWNEPVVLGFDGAWRGDSTALVACRLRDTSRPAGLFVLGHWESPDGDANWRTPVLEVEDRIREACLVYDVREVVFDPYRWQRTFSLLADEGLPCVEFPNTATRMVPVTQAFYEAILNGDVAHDGNPALARHIGNCVLKEDAKGARITKASKMGKRHIDLAVAAAMAHHRALHYTQPEQEKSYFLDLDSFSAQPS